MKDIVLISIIGGIGGALIGLASHKFKRPTSDEANKNSKRIRAIPMAIGFVIIGIVSGLQTSGLVRKWTASTPLEKVLAEMEPTVKGYPELHKKVSGTNPDEAKILMQQLSYRGLRRLPYEDLETRADLLFRMISNLDTESCAALVLGGGGAEQKLTEALNSLSKQDIQRFFALSMKAADLEVRGQSFTPIGPAQLFNGLQAFGSKLSLEDRKHLQAVLSSLSSQPRTEPKDVCWLGRTIYGQYRAVGRQIADPVFRGLVQN